MNSLHKKWVVACIDGSQTSDAVVDYAAWIAQTVQSPLTLMHVIEPSDLVAHTDHSGNLTPNLRESLLKTLSETERVENQQLIAQGKAMLEAAVLRIGDVAASVPQITTKQRHGSLAEAVTDTADDIRVLVLGIRGVESSQTDEVGSQLEDTIRAVHKPIFIVNGPFTKPRSMMLAFNDTDGARKALDMVCVSPLYKDMQVHLVHVCDNERHGQKLLLEAGFKLQQAGVTHQTVLLTGDAQTQLMEYQQQADIDMTVMGAFNYGKLRNLFFGSLTLKMLVNNNKPLLLLR